MFLETFTMKLIIVWTFVATHDIWGTNVYSQVPSSCSSGSLEGSLSEREFIFPSKIVGGLAAKPGEFPYQLSLRMNGRHFCGASLIEVDEILVAVTAAHCVDNGYYPGSLFVVAGDLKISHNSGYEQTREVVKIVIHDEYSDGYNPKGIFNDIALLFLDQPFQLDDNVKVINLPKDNEETEGLLTVSGWGTSSDGNSPDNLQYVQLPVVSQTVCQAKWKNHPYFPMEIGDGILCAGVDDGEMSTCHGDSGGPSVSERGLYLAGIVSFGDPSCRSSEYPGGFTKVSFYVEWIREQVGLFLEEA